MEGDGAPVSDEAPVTRDDLGAVRRWVVVAGVWAIAATAVALIALLDNSGDDASKRAGSAEDQIERVERELDGRIDDLEAQLKDLPQSADVSKLEDRLAKAEKDASAAARDAKSAEDTATDLEDRVETLEDDAAAGGDSGSGDGGTDTTP